jgi:hypothetical protein
MTLRPTPILLLLVALPLGAQDAAFGVKVNGLVPMSDLRTLTNSQLGFGASVFVEIPVGEGGAFLFRPTVGLEHIPEGPLIGLPGTSHASVTSLDLMLDALWFPGENVKQGPYLVGSIGGQQWRVSASTMTPSAINATRLGLAGGIGYQYSSRLGVEAKGFWSPIEKDLTATGLLLSVAWRF